MCILYPFILILVFSVCHHDHRHQRSHRHHVNRHLRSRHHRVNLRLRSHRH